MENPSSRTGLKCASLLAGGILTVSALFAAPMNPINVTLPQPVTTGSVILPAGTYVMSSFEMGVDDMFVLRGEHIAPVTLRAMRIEGHSGKTEVTLSKNRDTWHFDKLVLGDGEAFKFQNNK